MRLFVRMVLLSATMLIAACTSVSQKQLVYPELYPELYELAEFEFPPKFERKSPNRVERYKIAQQKKKSKEQHELAIQECEDAGGKWEGYLHGDSIDSYSNFYRCWSENEPLTPIESVVPEETGLLPFVIVLTYLRGEDEFVGFRRIYPDSQQQSEPDKD